jgi:hypothetical protein
MNFHRRVHENSPLHRKNQRPSSASGTFSPPLKSAVGRRTLDEHLWLRFHLSRENAS